MQQARAGLDGDHKMEFLWLSGAPEPLVEEFYRSLLQTTFPPEELISSDDLREALRRNANGVVALVDGRVAGGLVYLQYLEGAVQLLLYLVVSAAFRGQRLAPKLLRMGMNVPDRQLCLAEIEDPRHWQVSDQSDPPARVRFWARQGSRLLPLPYVQPSVSPQSERVPHLLLIAVPGAGESPPTAVPGRLVAGFIREYYLDLEGSISDADDELRTLLQKCEVERLPVWPLDRLDVVDQDS